MWFACHDEKHVAATVRGEAATRCCPVLVCKVQPGAAMCSKVQPQRTAPAALATQRMSRRMHVAASASRNAFAWTDVEDDDAV